MRPIALNITAFGPYAKKQMLRFADLLGYSIFLIHGPTGAGKSSLLDAICFALFGASSGGERKVADLRSHHASPELATKVVFWFAVGQRHYRVTRAPAHDRPGARGTRVTKEGAGAELVEIVPGAQPDPITDTVINVLGSTPREVDVAVEHLLRFNCEQFRQVAMLPQGQFEQFLLAKSTDREQILQTLFDTERYRTVEVTLVAEADRIMREIQAKRSHLEGILQPFAVYSSEALQEQYDTLQAERVVRRAEVETATAAHAAALVAHAAGKEAADRLADLQRAQDALRATQRDAAWMQGLRVRVDAAARAAQLDDLAEERATRERERDERQAHLQEVEQAHAAALAAHAMAALAVSEHERRAPERAEAAEIAVCARQAIVIAEEVAALRDEASRAEQELANLLEQQHDDTEADTALSAQIAELEQDRQEAALAVASCAGLALQLQGLQACRDQLVRLEELTTSRAASEQEYQKATTNAARAADAALRAEAAALDVEYRWTVGQAARLAAYLQPGDACPVCGATDHPRLANAEGEALDDATLKAARVARDEARAQADRAQRALAAVGQQYTRLRDQEQAQRAVLGVGDTDRTAVETAIQAAQDTLSAAQAMAATQETIARRLATAMKEHDVVRHRQEARSPIVEAAQAEAQRVQALLADRLRVAPDADTDPSLVRQAAERADAYVAQLNTALERAQQDAVAADRALAEQTARRRERQVVAEDAARAAEHAVQRFTTRLAELGFADNATYTAARLTPTALAELRSKVAAHDEEVTRANVALGEALRRTEGVAPPDLPILEQQVVEMAAAQEEATRADEASRQQLGRIALAIDTVRVLEAELAAEEERRRDLRHLADVACGKTPRKISFHRYMLARRLDTVLDNATQRLSTMTSGRFSLQRAVEARDRRAAAGLEIEVFDVHTGLPRRAETLSGGERFLAALALALGLADAVQAEAGGIVLETLFIDEGFGSLDEQALEQCLDVLLTLQEGGRRLVGIISHVAMLLDRIPAQLMVRRGLVGSEATFEVR